jgi:predicted kinase
VSRGLLVSLGGLPATGKTTLARALVVALGAVHVRIDTIEQAILRSGLARQPLDETGYVVGYALAEDLCRQGHVVVADSVNPLAITRDAWVAAAVRAGVPWIEVEVVCSDAAAHERRATTRVGDVPGLVLPTWPEIRARTFEPWARDRLVVDTGRDDVAACVDRVRAAAARARADVTS